MTQNAAAEPQDKSIATQKEDMGLRGLLSKENVKARFQEVLGKEAAVFSSSILSVVNGNKALADCDPRSILNAAFQAAALKLPITPGLGQAAIVPYKGVAQFQVMVRGIIQMAHRTGQYKRLNLAEVHEGELVEFNEFTGEVKLDRARRKSEKVIGYYFFFELVNGYRHEVYKSMTDLLAHGKKYSKAYQNGKGPWVDMPEVMCAKTIVKNTLAKWGPLSSDMRTAFTVDQAAIKDGGEPAYIDGTKEEEAEGYQMPEAAAAAGTEEAATIVGVLVEDAVHDKKSGDYRILMDGESFVANKAQYEEAKAYHKAGTRVTYQVSEGILRELAPVS